jgi:hypothetical protein
MSGQMFAWQLRRDPDYAPYCMRCARLVRMVRVEPLYWRCECGAEHDDRPRKAEYDAELARLTALDPRPLKRLMLTPGGHANPHEECPDCRGVCDPLNNEYYKDGFLK